MDHSLPTNAPLETLGPPWQVFFVILYSLTALTAILFNLLTIVVLVKGRRCSRDLRHFLINLAIADLLMATTSIPFTYTNYMFGRWLFWPILCPVVQVAQLSTITASIWLLVVIAIDRYCAILHPLKHSASWFKRHSAITVLLIWLLGSSIGLTQAWVTQSDDFTYQGVNYTSCGERWLPESPEGQLYTIFIFISTFVLPMLLLCAVHGAMAWRLWRYKVLQFKSSPAKMPLKGQSSINSHNASNNNHYQSRANPPVKLTAHKCNKVLTMLATVIAVFIFCWFPIQLLNILIYFSPDFLQVQGSNTVKYYAFVFGFFFCHWLSCAHSFMNTILYSLMSKNFREDTFTILAELWQSCTSSVGGSKQTQAGHLLLVAPPTGVVREVNLCTSAIHLHHQQIQPINRHICPVAAHLVDTSASGSSASQQQPVNYSPTPPFRLPPANSISHV